MLLSLHIENIAIIRELNIDFEQGFTALTGETGAGKSILIDSIGFLLGSRAQRELLRHGAERAMVSGLFGAFSDVEIEALASLDIHPDEDGTLLIERSISLDGRSQCRINGRMVNLSLLRDTSASLVHIHGQSDTALLLQPGYALQILDDYGTPLNLLTEYRMAYRDLCDARRALKEHKEKESERLRLEDTLKRQIAEIRKAAPKIDEEEQLYKKKNILKNAERITKLSTFAYRALKGGEKGSVLLILERVRQSLEQLKEMIPSLDEFLTALDGCMSTLDDIAEEVAAYADEEGEDKTELLNQIESRLDVLYHLSKRYGGSVTACLEFLNRAEKELSALENFEDKQKELEESVADKRENVQKLSLLLHDKRTESAKQLSSKLKATLVQLDLPSIQISLSCDLLEENGSILLNECGADDVRFLFSSGSAETPNAIDKIASGGEISRVMLALREALAEKSGVSTAIYDEIDTGVSGKTARKIGLKMSHAAKRGQVLCVTHSAQVASLADTHLLIHKQETNGRLETSVTSLNAEERTEEIARILGGIRVTDVQRAAAKEMLNNRDE